MNLYARKATKPVKAIRLACGECMGMDRRKKILSYPFADVDGCIDEMCPLFEWRLGKNPYKSKKRVERGRALAASRTTVGRSTS